MRLPISLFFSFCLCLCGHSQSLFYHALQASGVQKEATDGIHTISDKSLRLLQKKYDKLNASLDKQTYKMLTRMQRKEEKLKQKLCKQDSTKAAGLFTNIEENYKGLKTELKTPFDSAKVFPLTQYIPGVDSMQTALRFLEQQRVDLPADKIRDINKASIELQSIQDKLQEANSIEAFVRQRERQLKEQLQNSPLAKGLKSINKEAFYYGQRLREYKDLLNQKEKLEEKVLGDVRQSHLFQSFMEKNSYLAKLFPTPVGYDNTQALAGLQTRAGVQAQLQQRFGASAFTPSTASQTEGSGGSTNYLQQQMQSAQAQLGQLKDKMSKLGISGGSSDMTMPDFKPNSQHTKSFLERIEYGANIQSERSHSIIPATSDIALTAGYKLNDKTTIGLGASYKMGWGSEGIKHIRISHEGVGLRSYVDIKAKGSIWLSGGYEMNYLQVFSKYEQLKDLSAWQRSGLFGLTKKYKVGKKENNLQLLWDLLSYSQVPRSPALKFRVGFRL